MRKLASLQVIRSLYTIDNADNIELAKINEWNCVVKKNQFKEGELVVYFEIDSLLPEKEQFSFLAQQGIKSSFVDGKEHKGYRLKTIRLRGQVSQGLVLPISDFPELLNIADESLVEGFDCTELLGIVKFEKQIPVHLQGMIKGNFPYFIPKTDEERIQNCKWLLEKYKDSEFYVTEKLDGTSATFYKNDGIFGVCSRNMELEYSPGNTYWEISKQLKLSDNLPEGIAIQGEIIGPSIQGNKYKLNTPEFRLFNAYNIKNGEYFQPFDIFLFADKIGVKTVPVLKNSFKLSNNISVEELLLLSSGKSEISDIEREGIVIRPCENIIDPKFGRVSFKVVSNNFLLLNDE